MQIKFEMGECGRCGGSGKFSHNGEHDRCYGCNGSGEGLTPRGSRAHKAYDALIQERCTKFIDDPTIKVGDSIYLPSNGVDRKRSEWHEITEITKDPLNPKYPLVKFKGGIGLGYSYRAEVLVRNPQAIREIMREVASRFKGAILIED
jgi:hypothetical protein